MNQIPRHHRLARYLFADDPIRQMYGTSHLREILERDHRVSDEKELDGLEEEVYRTRRAYLEKYVGVQYEDDRVVGFDKERFENVYNEPDKFNLGFYLSYKLSPETIHELRPLYDAVRSSKSEQDGMAFLKHALSLRDYVVNIPFLLETIFNMRGNFETRSSQHPSILEGHKAFYETEKTLDKWIHGVVVRILSQYTTPKDKHPSYPMEDGLYYLVPKGTRLYRGFKKTRGPLNIERDFSFFVWDANSCIFYTIPSEETFYEDESYDKKFSHVENYCRQVGGIVEVRTTKDLRLLNFSKASVIRRLLTDMKNKGAPEKVISFLKEGWILSNNDPASNKYKRHSVYHKDMEVVKWLKNNGYNGYVAIGVEGLHDEIVIFNIKENVQIQRIFTTEDFNMPLCEEPYQSLGLGLFAN